MTDGLLYVAAALAFAMVILFAAVGLFGPELCKGTDVAYTTVPASKWLGDPSFFTTRSLTG
jgi:hypothetical protein